MEQQLVHSFKINNREEVRITLGQYKGRPYLDQRVYFQSNGNGEFRPSKDALRLSPAHCSELKKGMARAEELVASHSTPIAATKKN